MLVVCINEGMLVCISISNIKDQNSDCFISCCIFFWYETLPPPHVRCQVMPICWIVGKINIFEHFKIKNGILKAYVQGVLKRQKVWKKYPDRKRLHLRGSVWKFSASF